MKNNEKRSAGSALFTAIALFGSYISSTAVTASKYILKAIGVVLKALWHLTDRFRQWLISHLKKLGLVLLKAFIRARKAINKPFDDAKAEKEANGGRLSFGTALNLTNHILFGKHGVFVILFNIAVPVISVFFLFSVIAYSVSLNYAVKLSVNGRFLGYIENEQVFLDAQEVLRDRVSYLGSDITIDAVPSYSIEQIGSADTLTKYQIADLVLQNSGVSLDYGYGFYINDTFYGALMDYTNVRDTLDDLLKKHKTNNPSEVVEFVDEIRYDEAGLYLTDSVIDEKWLIDLLTGTKRSASYYTVEYGDSIYSVMETVNKTESELEAMNPGITETELHVGDKIKYSEEIPFLSVSITRTEVYNVPSQYDTETYSDNTIYEGSSREMRKGVYGENRVTADVTYVNGVEVGRNITDVTVLSKPVNQIIAIGVKPTPAGTFIGSTAAYGKLIWPVRGGYISEWTAWDGGYRGHVGIDIAGMGWGDPVYAGASGVVTYAGWNGQLGNYVEIYHPDLGISSGYAHNSAIYVYVGQQVAQGECISGAGATGTAYGTHVHLTVKVNGGYVNPRAYLDYSGHRVPYNP
ncbi:MAG: peptidoglycan DD-metalloendopeptidase family protein [Oscillospiraceae bacterium]|nr:peptidoglycan DD-metalloendopeptidase family protein [Oscillospiraceae bacterium]